MNIPKIFIVEDDEEINNLICDALKMEFELPNSKIKISYSTQFNKSSNNNSSTFTPDNIVEISIKDYMNKTDPVLDYILKSN